jgi:hypothetical protein
VIQDATAVSANEWYPPSDLELRVYIESIPETMKKAYALAMAGWKTNATGLVVEATYNVIRVAERLWVGLSAWFPPKHFGNKDAGEYFGEYIAQRYELRYALVEPEGPGSGGSMMRPMVAYGVLLDVQDTIVLTVRLMLAFRPPVGIDVERWEKKFAAAIDSYPC